MLIGPERLLCRNNSEKQLTASRTVYPSPYGTSAPTPAQIVPSAARPATMTVSAQPSVPATEPATVEQGAAHAPSASPVPPMTIEPLAPEAPDPKLVDINTASVDELNRLGGRFGRAIIAGRPYATTDDLVSKRVLTRSTFSQIKDQITAN